MGKFVSHAPRNGGLTTAAVYGRDYMRVIGSVGRLQAFSVYGASEEARRLRAGDLGRKTKLIREGGPAAWERLMRRRERAFGLPAGSLSGKEVGMSRNERSG